MNPTLKPYLIRALHEWCSDQGHTPYIQVWVNEHTRVPMQFVKDNQIILNIGATACAGLNIDNDEIWIPVGHIGAIYARETGEGMNFDITPYEPGTPPQPEAGNSGKDSKPAGKHKGLKLVK